MGTKTQHNTRLSNLWTVESSGYNNGEHVCIAVLNALEGKKKRSLIRTIVLETSNAIASTPSDTTESTRKREMSTTEVGGKKMQKRYEQGVGNVLSVMCGKEMSQ